MTTRRVNKRFARNAFGIEHSALTPAQRNARKQWLADSFAREKSLEAITGRLHGGVTLQDCNIYHGTQLSDELRGGRAAPRKAHDE